ncbi:MAG: IPT/TIG domain-containing protein [bacterium]
MQKQVFKLIFLISLFLILPNLTQAAPIPVLNFSDIDSGPKVGNTDGVGSGAIVTIWGNYLGSATGTSKVYVGNVEATAIYYWKNADGQLPGGPAELYSYHKMQEIAFAIPASAPDGLTTIKVVVNGIETNTLPFTVRSGNIYFIKAGGNDTTGNGSWGNAWATLQSTFIGGNNKLTAGDIVYSVGVGTNVGLEIGKNLGINGTLAQPISIAQYPGTKINISGNTNIANTIYYYNTNEFWNWSKISVTTTVSAFALSRKNRIVGVEITGPTVYGGYSGALGGGCNGDINCFGTEGGKYLGLYIHNYGTDNGVPSIGNIGTDPSTCPYSNPACKSTWDRFQHLFYISNRSGGPREAYEIGWNNLIDNPIAPGIHIYDQSPCGDWTGTMEIHNNVIKNQRGSAINVDLSNCTPRLLVPFRIYNNIIINDATVAYGGRGITIIAPGRAETPLDQIQVYNNTVYGQIQSSNFVNFPTNQVFKNNIFVDTQNVDFFEQYGGSPLVSSNNLFYSLFAKAAPSWTGTGSIMANPLFIDAANFDFPLQPTSPAKTAGSDATLAVAPTDFYGQSRPAGSVSMGAIQYVSAVVDTIAPAAPTGLDVI